jgi:hypothetical protein
VNATTKVIPAKALLGYLPTLDPLAPSITRNEWVEERAVQASRSREQAQVALDRVAERTPKSQFKKGDCVWLEAKNLALPYQTRKLAPRHHGPFLITKQVSPVAYQLGLPPTWTIHDVFHASLLTPYHETKEHGVNYSRPPPEMVDGEEEFEVEAIMGHHFFGRGRKLQYLVQWKGYSAADDTWEPQEQVFAPQKITKYHQAHPRNQPFPHKRGTQTRGRTISLPLIAPCLTPRSTPQTNHHANHRPLTLRPHRPLEARLLCQSPSLAPKSPSRWTRTRNTRRPLPTEGLPLLIKSTLPSRPAQPSPSSKHLELEGTSKTFAEWLRSPPARSLLAPRHTKPVSQLCRLKMTGSAPTPSPPRPTPHQRLPTGLPPQWRATPALLCPLQRTSSPSPIHLGVSRGPLVCRGYYGGTRE